MSWSLDEAFALFERQTNLERSDLGLTRAYRLERMVALLARVGNPQERLTVVHIAGSKGKGSTATIIAHLLAAGGARVGLYTSPHILDYRERIRVLELADGAVHDLDLERVLTTCSERTWELAADQIAADAAPGRYEAPTTFELLTTLAFLAYEQVNCDWVVLETGLGGRLDATNVCLPSVCIITRIELEHTEYLGDTIAAIAGEKAGIIKAGVPVVVAPQTQEAETVIRARAAAASAPYIAIDPAALRLSSRWEPHRGTTISMQEGGQEVEVVLPLVGNTQAVNVAAALTALRVLERSGVVQLPPAPILAERLRTVQLTARGEVVAAGHPCTRYVLDGAHTPQSVGALFATLAEGGIRGCVVLFAAAEGKDVIGIVAAVSAVTTYNADATGNGAAPINTAAPRLQIRQVVVTRAGTFKRSEPTTVGRWREAGFATSWHPTEAEALAHATAAAAETGTTEAGDWSCPVIVTGSFYLVAQVKRLLAAMDDAQCR